MSIYSKICCYIFRTPKWTTVLTADQPRRCRVQYCGSRWISITTLSVVMVCCWRGVCLCLVSEWDLYSQVREVPGVLILLDVEKVRLADQTQLVPGVERYFDPIELFDCFPTLYLAGNRITKNSPLYRVQKVDSITNNANVHSFPFIPSLKLLLFYYQFDPPSPGLSLWRPNLPPYQAQCDPCR